MRKLLLPIALWFAMPMLASAQSDALLQPMMQALKSAANDTARVRVYNQFFQEWIVRDVAIAKSIARTGLIEAEKMKWPKAIAVFKSNIGRTLSDEGSYDSCIYYYQQALQVHLSNKDAYNAASTLNNMGSAATNIRSDYTTAADYYFKALRIADSSGAKELVSVCLSNIASTFFIQENYTKALEYAQKSSAADSANPNLTHRGENEKLLGSIYFKLNNKGKAKQHMEKALAYFEEDGNNMGQASMLGNLALLVDSNFAYIINMRSRAAALWREANPTFLEALVNMGNLGIAYADSAYKRSYLTGIQNDATQQALLQQAAQLLATAIQLFEQTGELDNRSTFIGKMAEVAALKKDYEKAYLYYRQYREIQDSVYSQDVKNKIAEAESKRLVERKENDVRLAKLALSNQRKMAVALGLGALLLVAIVLLLVRQNRLKQRVNQQLQQLNEELANANEVKATFFGILSHDLRGPVARVANLLHLQTHHPDMLPANANQQAAETVDELLQTMDDVLLWSKGQMKQFAPVYEIVSLQAWLNKLGEPYQRLPQIQFSIEVPQDAAIVTDVHFLGSIIQNMSNNAVKALTNTPHAVLQWKAQNTGEQITILIADNGPGMDAETVSDILNNRQIGSGKTGLGFHIIRDMAKAIGAEITIESSPGKGTTMRISLNGK